MLKPYFKLKMPVMIFHSQKDCVPFLELMTANFGKGQKHVIRVWQNYMP